MITYCHFISIISNHNINLPYHSFPTVEANCRNHMLMWIIYSSNETFIWHSYSKLLFQFAIKRLINSRHKLYPVELEFCLLTMECPLLIMVITEAMYLIWHSSSKLLFYFQRNGLLLYRNNNVLVQLENSPYNCVHIIHSLINNSVYSPPCIALRPLYE